MVVDSINLLRFLLLALIALTGSEATVTVTPPGIGEIVTCAALDANMECLDGTTLFDGHSRVNASAQSIGLNAGDKIEMVWLLGDAELERMELTIEEAGSFPVGAWIVPDPVFPNGQYRVRYLLNGEAVQEATFEIAGVLPELTEVTFCAAAPENATCSPRSTPFDGSETLHFLLTFSAVSDTDLFTARLLLDDQLIVEVNSELASGPTYTVPLYFEPEPVLISGEYRLDLLLNGQEVEQLAVAIEGPPAAIIGLTTCDRVDAQQRCLEAADLFDGQSAIYAATEFVAMAPGAEIVAHWFVEEEPIGQVTYTVERAGNGAVAFHYAPEGPMADAAYHVDILYEDQVVASAPFRVDQRGAIGRSPLRGLQSCGQVSADYACIEPTVQFAPDEILYVIADLVGLAPGETISARWLTGDTLLEETVFTAESGGSGSISFELKSDLPFQPGSYRVQIYIGDELADELELTVAVQE